MQRVQAKPLPSTGRSRPVVMGPAILASGYLVKRTRSLGRWKKRWWQLTDDGTLIYFKGEERTKALGEIDVGRSCYEVRFGADQCKADFPAAVPDCCCFSFSVLKRTYYMYAANPADAKHWADSIASLSAVLNYKKKMAGRRPAPEPPNASQQLQRPLSTPCSPVRGSEMDEEGRAGGKRCYSLPITDAAGGHGAPRLPKVHASISGDVTYTQVMAPAPKKSEEEREAADRPTELPRISKPSRGGGKPRRDAAPPSARGRYGSAPNLFFGTGNISGANRAKRGSPHHQKVKSHLWLDGSPPPNLRSTPTTAVTRTSKTGRKSALGYQQQQYPYGGGSLDRLHLKRRRGGRKIHAGQQQLVTRWPVDMDGYELPTRPQSVDVSVLPNKRSATPARQRQRPDASGATLVAVQTTSSNFGDLRGTRDLSARSVPPPVKPKPILKKPTTALHSPETDNQLVLPTIPDADEPDNTGVSPPEIPPKHFSLKVSVDSGSGQRSMFLPPPPNFKPPPPPERAGSDTSSLSVSSCATDRVSSSLSNKPITSPNDRGMAWYNNPSAFLRQVINCVIRTNSICILKTVQIDLQSVWLSLCYSASDCTMCTHVPTLSHTHSTQLTMEIKRIGMQQMDGSICTTFRKLQKETEGIFPDLIGVLVLARRFKVCKK